jgi:hypothetical protein
MGCHKSGKVTLGNYIDKVEVVREMNRQGFGYFVSNMIIIIDGKKINKLKIKKNFLRKTVKKRLSNNIRLPM